MKILLISHLYPFMTNLDEDKNTKALHNFVKFWGDDVEVIRPLIMPMELKEVIKNKIFQKKILIDNINVNIIPIWRIPQTTNYVTIRIRKHISKQKIKPDIILVHRLNIAYNALKIAKRMKIPFIIGLHNSDVLYLKENENYRKYNALFEEANQIACRSFSIQKEVEYLYPQHLNKCFFAYSGVENEIITPLERSLLKLENWKSKKEKVSFITVAALRKFKNIDINLKSLAMLSKDISWEYTIVGEGEELTNLIRLSEELGIRNKVNFLGHLNREEVLKVLENSNIYIMVSSPETFGLSYIEAMAKGCVVIGAYNNGIDGVIINGKNGYLCSPRVPEEITDKIEHIMSQEFTETKELLEMSYKTILEFTEQKAADSYFKKIINAIKTNLA